MDNLYWTEYYKRTDLDNSPSNFAKFCLREYLIANNTLLELGCGNGRDSIFFASNEISVDAIDQCELEINKLSQNNILKNLKFITMDFTNLKNDNFYNAVYSRFTIHAVTEHEENRVIKWCSEHIKAGGYFFIEVRGKENELFGKGEPVQNCKDSFIFDGHFRRFIDLEIIKNKLIRHRFKIKFAAEDFGFAPFNGIDEKFIRIVAKRLY